MSYAVDAYYGAGASRQLRQCLQRFKRKFRVTDFNSYQDWRYAVLYAACGAVLVDRTGSHRHLRAIIDNYEGTWCHEEHESDPMSQDADLLLEEVFVMRSGDPYR